MSDLPKGYLKCPKCSATFPGETEEKKPVERCPGCGLDTDQFRPRTARLAFHAVNPLALPGKRFGLFEIAAIGIMVLSAVGLAVFLLMRRAP